MDEVELTTFQVEVAHAIFELEASEGYVVAGGAALIASELISRPTKDPDLFTSAPVMSFPDSPTFCRLVVTDRDDEVLVDLAVDSPPHLAPTMTLLGPTLAPLELAGRKLLPRSGRGPRLRRRLCPCRALRTGCAL